MSVISVGNMFLLSLNSGGSAAHPLAEEPTWEIDWMQARLSVRIIGLQIFGPYLAWKTPYGGDAFGDHLQVRNWKTGCTLWVRGSFLQYRHSMRHCSRMETNL